MFAMGTGKLLIVNWFEEAPVWAGDVLVGMHSASATL